ncbi:hypothetical protein HYT23_01310 [Candidatus Pacearchaeota archaeon]|nr:hypothetical protein [Candidatus Pacearchaeota archaeon]
MGKKGILFFGALLFFFIANVGALGLSPAGVDINFEPGYEQTIDYLVFGVGSRGVEAYVGGDLEQYATLSKTKLTQGDDRFSVTIKLPQEIGEPGRHIIYVGVKQLVDEELASTVGTSVAVNGAIFIHVPYPGRYLDIGILKSGDANVGEPILFSVSLINQGTENLVISPKINILDNFGADKNELDFTSREILSQEKLELKKTFDTAGYNPGTYKAIASVDYGIVAKDEISFRIGSLSVNILNYTNIFYIKKLQKFEIWVASGWNNNLDGVSAIVSIKNGSNEITSFETTSTILTPWEEKKIEGYFDGSLFKPGTYDAEIKVRYYGREQGETTTKEVKIEFIKPKSIILWLVIGGAGILIIIVLILIKVFKKNGYTRRKK